MAEHQQGPSSPPLGLIGAVRKLTATNKLDFRMSPIEGGERERNTWPGIRPGGRSELGNGEDNETGQVTIEQVIGLVTGASIYMRGTHTVLNCLELIRCWAD